MATFSYPDPAATNYPLSNLIEPARGEICRIVGGLNGANPLPQTGIGQALNNAVIQQICPPRLLPPPPAPSPVPGGQCNTLYRVWIKYIDIIQGNVQPEQEIEVSNGNFQGAVTGLKIVDGGIDNFGGHNRTWYVVSNNGSTETGALVRYFEKNTSSTARISRIARKDGQPDTCGDGEPQPIPPITPVAPNQNITVNVNNTNVTLPFFFTPIIFDPTLSLEPHIAVQVGSVNIDFSLGGINVTQSPLPYNPPSPPPALPPGTPTGTPVYPTPPQTPRPRTPPGGGGGGCPDVDLAPIVALLNSLDAKYNPVLDCDRCRGTRQPLKPLLSTVLFSGNSGKIALPPQCIFVRLDLVNSPENAKFQAGGNADTVYYLGWTSFLFGTGNNKRVPISYTQNVYLAPTDATHFSFTCYNGYTARITALSLQRS